MSKTLTKDELSLNAHVEELRERMRMLQSDRKANIDVLEANKSANKEEIKKLRDDNKEFRQKLASLQRVRSYFGSFGQFNYLRGDYPHLTISPQNTLTLTVIDDGGGEE